MSKLTASIDTFLTGDLVFTRYPPKYDQPIHVTLFLHRNLNGTSRYVHAGGAGLGIANASTYIDDKDSGGYLRARLTDKTLRDKVATIAQMFAQTAQHTPYGSYPSSKDFQRLGVDVKKLISPHASRFTGMVRTTSLAEIPFEFAALVRLLKWTLRAIESAPLSKNRGITCAAFASICVQVSRMLIFFEEAGAQVNSGVKFRTCVNALNGLVESKASLRTSLDKIVVDETRGQTIYRDQAYRENSNRKLTPAGRQALGSKRKNIDYTSLSDEARRGLKKHAPSAELEGYWLVIQTEWFDIHEANTKMLQEILGDFFFDAKYVSSPVLSRLVRGSADWNEVVFDAY